MPLRFSTRLWDQPAQSWSNRRLIGVLLLFVGAYSAAGVAFMGKWEHLHGLTITNLGFGYGVLLEALQNSGLYRVCNVHYPGICFSAHRLPLIPYLMLGLKALVGDDLLRIDAAKSVIFNSLLAVALYLLLRRSALAIKFTVGSLGLALLMPRWILNAFELSVEEGYMMTTLALLVAMLWFPPKLESRGKIATWGFALGLLAVVLLFCKNSMVYWAAVVPFLFALQARSITALLSTLFVVLSGFALLCIFNHQVSGRFTVGSSWEGWNLYKGNNPYTAKLYPTYNLDNLDYMGLVVADRPLHDEWDYNDYFKKKAVAFIRENPGQFLELSMRKTWVFYIEVRETGLFLGHKPMSKPWHWVQMVWMITFRLVLFWTIISSLRILGCSKERLGEGKRFAAFSYLLFLTLYSGFYIIGFAYERHVMPIVLPTVMLLLLLRDQSTLQEKAAV
jgi:hypothetical protein